MTMRQIVATILISGLYVALALGVGYVASKVMT